MGRGNRLFLGAFVRAAFGPAVGTHDGVDKLLVFEDFASFRRQVGIHVTVEGSAADEALDNLVAFRRAECGLSGLWRCVQ